jgi:peptidylprolyl isomerase
VRRSLAPLLLVVALVAVGATVAAPSGAATGELRALTITGDVGQKPTVAVTGPVAVKTTTREVVSAGTGEKAAKGNKVTFDYVIVNGRTGDELETSFGVQPVSLVLDEAQAQPVIVENLVGTPVGSRVVIAIAPKEGFAKSASSNPASPVKKNDTLLFVVDLASASTPLTRATGAPVAPVEGLPTVKLAKSGKPKLTVPQGDPPAALVAQPLITGAGTVVQAGQTLTVHYRGVIWDSGKTFDSSWSRKQPAEFPIGNGSVIAGWDEGLVGQTVGSQVLLVIPPDKGYGSDGAADAGIEGTDTLVFVVDILDAT